MNSKRRFLSTLASSALGLSVGSVAGLRNIFAAGTQYPENPIRIIATYEPGGTNDIMARLAAQILHEAFGVGVTVENRPGASGTLGTSLVAHAKSDGYTLLAGTFGPITTAPTLFTRLPYDPIKDFAPVARLATVPNVIVVNPKSPSKTLVEFIANAKASAKPLTFGVVYGGTPQFLIKQLELETGITLLDVPYKSGTAALTDLVGNRLDIYVDNVPALLPLIKSDVIRALATANETRSPVLPEVPTTVELGYPGAVISAWHGILATGGTPPAIVNLLNQKLVAALHTAAIRNRIETQGGIVIADTPSQFASFIRSETVHWASVAKQSGIVAA